MEQRGTAGSTGCAAPRRAARSLAYRMQVRPHDEQHERPDEDGPEGAPRGERAAEPLRGLRDRVRDLRQTCTATAPND